MDTIFALSSAPGKAGVAVIRISGPCATSVAPAFSIPLPPPKKISLRKLCRDDSRHLDTALVVYLPKGASYTGEDTLELHVHGGVATVNAILEALGAMENLRFANPGEFTLQAFLNGRMDLSEVEGISDLIAAETEAQRVQALRLLNGALGHQTERWRSGLIKCASLIELTLDFSDEELPSNILDELLVSLTDLVDELRDEIQGVKAAERIREGFEVAIIGRPNVGKSTLLNFLAGREAAITSERAGTTRDVVEVRMDLAGLPVTLLDLAGIQETADPLELLGIERARERGASADLRLYLVDNLGIPAHAPVYQDGDLIRSCKADLAQSPPADGVSGITGDGVDALIDSITSELTKRSRTAVTATHVRHRKAIESSHEILLVALDHLREGSRSELVAEDLRYAIRSLESLTGRIDIEDVLEEIFSGFCIGK